jgi:ribosomal protein L37AE/L43A
MPDQPQVACPGCGRKQAKRGGRDTIYYCSNCRCQFDDDPNEHGTAIHRDPERNAQSKEEYQLRQQQLARQKKARRW